MARKQKKLNSHEKKWLKETTKTWRTLTWLVIPHKNNDKPVLGSILDPVLDQFLGIQEWGHHIAPVRFNKLITATELVEYLRSSKGISSVKLLK